MAKKAKPVSQRTERIGIISPYGNIWTQDTFDTKEEAKAHLEGFWQAMPPRAGVDLRKYKFVPVRVTVTVLEK